MDDSLSPKLDSEVNPKDLGKETQASKRNKKMIQRTVVTVKLGTNVGKQKNEGPPSDFWSWRKYGQKPIKGSPYPRGYYKCSTSKGCSAKKQVERCRTDASVLIITYTSSHNHPGPDISTTANLADQPPPKPNQVNNEELPALSPKEEQQKQQQEHEQGQGNKKEQTSTNNATTTTTASEDAGEDTFYYIQSPISCSRDIIMDQEEDPFTGNLGKTHTHHQTLGNFVLDEEPLSYSQLMCFSTPSKLSEENDFFDELEELPTSSSSSFTSYMGMRSNNNLSEDMIPVVPS
ncbi:probable WRKY transcription factor 35 [Ziziphus jujuba]|uniref:WRKY domain-containing protein n=2 Tax=Ziziphus jujuba TaxID=326968 RepID=A0A978UQ14_ZIZJJ|nr:probable WRKY transcription factor 35 [Ziziphus jujuba]KAH7516964.1 hypothetical protein FEM48_Zijuj09G0011900 [Ziziphus jujuba var. spinosa]